MSSAGGWLAFTLFYGAAMNDGTLEQRAIMREITAQYLPALRSENPDIWKPALTGLMTNVQQTMGEGWEPTGEWAEQINRLVGEPRAVSQRETTSMDVGQQTRHGAALGQVLPPEAPQA